jgi:hypothetical protein
VRSLRQPRVRLRIRDVERRPSVNRLAMRVSILERHRVGRSRDRVSLCPSARVRGELDPIAGHAGDERRISLQKPDGAVDDRVEHRLDIGLRAADDAQDIAGGGLLVERRRQLTVASLKLPE